VRRVPNVTPTLPLSSGARGGTTVLYGTLAPTRSGGMSRIGVSIAAYPPVGVIQCFTGWGFLVGVAPPGMKTLTVSVDGATIEAAGAAAFIGSAGALCELWIKAEEFVPLAPVDVGVDPSTFRPGATPPATAIASPGHPLAGRQYSQSFFSSRTIIRHWVIGVGLQVLPRQGGSTNITLRTPITPGNAYRCWVVAGQNADCHSPLTPAGWAYCNFTFDFGPIFYDFSTT
jgi:hypothetical protein